MQEVILGIDIAKGKFNVDLLKEDKHYQKVCENNEKGFQELEKWLEKHKVEKVHACMEATNIYWEALAEYLYAKEHKVSVVNPSVISSFAKTKLLRNKTDEQDAKSIAEYCLKYNPIEWKPTPKEVKHLQALVRRLESLKHLQQEEKNRLASTLDQMDVKQSLLQSIEFFQQQIHHIQKLIVNHIDVNPQLKADKELLTSIPGIGDITAANILAELVNINNYKDARQAAAYAGLTPRHFTSGSSVDYKPHLCKIGNSRLRKILYFPAIVAKHHNPILMAFANRLSSRGKHSMVIIGALMRKLIHIAFGVLRSRKPFDPSFLSS
jgi:transposase